MAHVYGASGNVRWSAGGIDGGPCASGSSCQYRFAAGTRVQFVAEPGPRGSLTGWGHECVRALTDRTCTVIVTADGLVSGTFTLLNPIFVTSVAVAPNSLGGIAAADRLCTALAADAGLPGMTYLAVLSTPDAGIRNRLSPNARGWIRTDGLPFADTQAGLFTRDEVFYPPRLDERGNDVWTASSDVSVFTGLNGAGLPFNDECSGFTDGGSGQSITSGIASGGAGIWLNSGSTSCNAPARFYCMANSFNAPLPMGADAGTRRAFISRLPFLSGGGIAAADQHCQNDGADAGLGRTFRALLATNGTTPSSRFDAGGPAWQLANGVFLGRTAADFFIDSSRLAGVSQYSTGAYAAGNYGYWTGASGLNGSAGTTGSTCVDWVASTSGATGNVSGNPSLSGGFFRSSSPGPCDITYARLICLEP